VKIVCPTCRTQLEDVPDDYGPRPFCSERCKLADLNNWLTESYRISAFPDELDDISALQQVEGVDGDGELN
jgi:endogenous inhibitor of DNA gyrase (YacG/DUF329 family)